MKRMEKGKNMKKRKGRLVKAEDGNGLVTVKDKVKGKEWCTLPDREAVCFTCGWVCKSQNSLAAGARRMIG